MKYLIPLLLFSTLLKAQGQKVYPVLSEDYSGLIHRADTTSRVFFIPASSLYRDVLSLKGDVNDRNLTSLRIKVQPNQLELIPAPEAELIITGNYRSSVSLLKTNHLPSLQQQYVQGREGSWRGAETGEMFSYGPPASTLEFDGSSYLYDKNGRLVPAGNGNDKKAGIYDNSILRTGSVFTNMLTLNGDYKRFRQSPPLKIQLSLGQINTRTLIRENNNTSRQLGASLNKSTFNGYTFNGRYDINDSRFGNANRNGFLNRVYQNALLTPISFENAQSEQHSYSPLADNPLYLLREYGNQYQRTKQHFSFQADRNYNRLPFSLSPSLETISENITEGYPDGSHLQRTQYDYSFHVTGSTSYKIEHVDYHLKSLISAKYIFTDVHSDVNYHGETPRERYQRTSRELLLEYKLNYSINDFEFAATGSNNTYLSNPASRKSYFLPAVSATAKYTASSYFLSLSSSYSVLNSELPITQSQAGTNLLHYTLATARNYKPITEVSNYDQVIPTKHKEWSTLLTALLFRNALFLSANYFNRTTLNDVSPVFSNNTLVMQNIAGHTNKGIELSATLTNHSKRISSLSADQRISFFSYRNRITSVASGYDNYPIAGFSDVHAALINGAPMGAIVGSTYLRDNKNRRVVDEKGFPLADQTLKIIADPNPDFVVKLNHNFSYKRFSLQIDWEWKKGGEMWNGTQAALDYYGRSALSARQRNMTGYVFSGVTTEGHPNNIPVSFNDPSLPLQQNRWVRYGLGGIAEGYVQKTDYLRINDISFSLHWNLKKYISRITATASAGNILLWTPYKGADPAQRTYDLPNTAGLDYFNLPASRTTSLYVSLQF